MGSDNSLPMAPIIGGTVGANLIEGQLPEITRLAASIQQGTVTASLILRKLLLPIRRRGGTFTQRAAKGSRCW